MPGNRFRKLSLRILLFVVLPFCALGFLIGSQYMTAQHQVAALRALYDSNAVVSGLFMENDVWWAAFWGGNPVNKINMVTITGTKEELDAIAGMTHLQRLELDKPVEGLSPEIVRQIASRHPRMKHWSVVNGNLPAETWAAIGELAAIGSFEASQCNLTDTDLREFADAPLTELRLDGCPRLTDLCCHTIAKLRKLKILSLQSMAITDQGIALLDQLSDLEAFSLGQTQVAGGGLAVLKRMPRLSMLSVSECPVNAVGFQHIATLRKLQSLDLDGTALNDQQLHQFVHMTEMKSLYLGGTEITNEGLRHVVQFPNLTDLNISFTRVDDEGIRRLAGLKGLQIVQCYGTYTSPAALNRLASQLQHDRLRGSVWIYWNGAAFIDAETCEVISYLPCYPDDVSNDKGVAGTKRTGGRVFVFPLQSGNRFILIPDNRTTAMLSDDGRRLATVGFTDLKSYDLQSGRLLSSSKLKAGAFTTLVSLVGDQVISRDGNQITARDFKTGRTHWVTAASSPMLRDENIAANETRLVCSTPSGLDLIDLGTGQTARVVQQRLGRIGAEVARTHLVGFASDGRTIAAQVFDDAPIRIGDLSSGELIATIDVVPDHAVMSENAKFIATHMNGQQHVVIWNAMTGKQIGRVEVKIYQGGMMFTPDGRYLIVDVDPAAIDVRR